MFDVDSIGRISQIDYCCLVSYLSDTNRVTRQIPWDVGFSSEMLQSPVSNVLSMIKMSLFWSVLSSCDKSRVSLHSVTTRTKMPFFPEQNNILQLNDQQFDFNIQFEQLFFSIIPSVLFIVTSLWRAASQVRKPTVVNAPVFQLIKLVTTRF